jgi:hypothetical protein
LQHEQQETYKQTAHCSNFNGNVQQAAHCVMAPALFNHGNVQTGSSFVSWLCLFMVIMFNQAAHCVMAKFKHLCSSLSLIELMALPLVAKFRLGSAFFKFVMSW